MSFCILANVAICALTMFYQFITLSANIFVFMYIKNVYKVLANFYLIDDYIIFWKLCDF